MARTSAARIIVPAALLAALLAAGCDPKVASTFDRTPPSVSITSPADGTTVSGVGFRVDVDATDDDVVAEVRFHVNGGTPVIDTEEPWSATLVSLDQAEGSTIEVEIEAVDPAGNVGTTTASYTVAARTLTQLTTNPLADENPAWSPDGTRIAFQSKRNGDQFDLWVMDADGSNQDSLTTNVNEDRNPAWSPDGAWIAFDTNRAGTYDVWLLPLSGGEAAADSLTFGNNDDIQPAWSPDGMTVYFSSDRGTASPFNIWRQAADGSGAPVQVTAFLTGDFAPALSSDGTRLAFASALNFTEDHIYVMTIGDVAVAPLTGDTGFTETDPVWLPDADVVFFSRDDGTGSNVWFQGSGNEAVPVQATFGSGTVGDGGAAWSPDGTRLAFHSDRSGNDDIWVIE